MWGWGLADVDTAETEDDVEMGQSIDEFIDRVSKKSAIIYFHNLGFDSAFILDAIMRDGFKWTKAQPKRGEFTTFISKMGSFYSMKVVWRNGRKTEFRDSWKKLPMSVARLAKAFKQPVGKGDIDYHTERPVGHVITPEERYYIALDVLIVAKALRQQLSEGLTRLTIGSDALAEFKRLTGSKWFLRTFPILSHSMDNEIRAAYRGGFTYADPRFSGRVVGCGQTFDVNSLYPDVMYHKLLPYGEPVFEPGLPEPTQLHPLFIVSLTFTAKLKAGHIPCIQVKGDMRFNSVEYQTDIKEPVTLSCTNVDLELWGEHYDLDILSYNGGWKFKGLHGAFNDYIDKWMEVKANNEGGIRELAKLMLNNLYGKFATNPDITAKVPVFEDNRVKLVMGEPEVKEPVYTAMGAFITAYARDKTIRAAQANYDVFAYADTDSLHLLTLEAPAGVDVDPHKLGAWKHEYNFTNALFVRSKVYAELKDDGEYETHIAGMPKEVADTLTFADFTDGRKFAGKLSPKRVPGGVVLEDVLFTLNM